MILLIFSFPYAHNERFLLLLYSKFEFLEREPTVYRHDIKILQGRNLIYIINNKEKKGEMDTQWYSILQHFENKNGR